MTEKYLERILLSKSWNNILLREQTRNELIFNHENKKLDEKQITSYLNALKEDELIDLRERVFKLTRDHFIEYMLKRLPKPQLKPLNQTSNKYILKCNIIKDLLDCLYYLIDSSSEGIKFLPERCTEFFEYNNLKFPLGKTHLKENAYVIRMFKSKLLKHQMKLKSLAQLTANIDDEESIQLIKNENQFLRGCLTILLIVFLIMSALFFTFYCFDKKCSNK